jgi:hypothetical protein
MAGAIAINKIATDVGEIIRVLVTIGVPTNKGIVTGLGESASVFVIVGV